ncbi:MAG TPA: DUF3107 domain-containing protein [Acidimicrobiales bacterium]
MHVRIGVTYNPREIEIELADDAEPDTVKGALEQAITDGHGIFWLTDRKGRQVGIAVEKLAWVELGSGADLGRIGFGAS